jgi:hypothetical protein
VVAVEPKGRTFVVAGTPASTPKVEKAGEDDTAVVEL